MLPAWFSFTGFLLGIFVFYRSELNFDVIQDDISQGKLPNTPVNVPLLCFLGSYILSRVPKLVMMCKELLRGEFVRGLEHSTFLSLFASLYLLAKNDQPDRLTAKRVINFMMLTGTGTLPAIIASLLYNPIAFFNGLYKKQLPVGIYNEDSFDKIYGDEYIVGDSSLS